MKIVIDIPKHIYEHAKEQSEDSNDEWDAMRAIANGTPLPKGHGDLIDRNDLLEYTDINTCAYTPTINRYNIITTPTIIEADKRK